MVRFSKSRENGAEESGGKRVRDRELQVRIRHLMIEGPKPWATRGRVPVSLRAPSIPPRLPVTASRCVRLCPPWLPGTAPGATLSALIRRAARPPRTSPLPGAAPALLTQTPRRCRRGRPDRCAPTARTLPFST